jgi:hypothetical protein
MLSHRLIIYPGRTGEVMMTKRRNAETILSMAVIVGVASACGGAMGGANSAADVRQEPSARAGCTSRESRNGDFSWENGLCMRAAHESEAQGSFVEARTFLKHCRDRTESRPKDRANCAGLLWALSNRAQYAGQPNDEAADDENATVLASLCSATGFGCDTLVHFCTSDDIPEGSRRWIRRVCKEDDTVDDEAARARGDSTIQAVPDAG